MKISELLAESAASSTIGGVKFKKESKKGGVSYIIANQDDNFFITNKKGEPAEQCKMIQDMIGNDIKIIRSGANVGKGGFRFEEEDTKDHFGEELFSVWFGDTNTDAAKEMRSTEQSATPVNRINFNFTKSVKDEKMADKIVAAFIKGWKI